MAKDWLMIIRYLVTAEESRPGRMDYWNSVFLADRTPMSRVCLETAKMLFVLTLSICLPLTLIML